MLHQSLPVEIVIENLQALCANIRENYGESDLFQVNMPVALVVGNIMEAIGLTKIRGLALTASEMQSLDDGTNDEAIIKCQVCGQEEATALSTTRRGKLLLCPDCAAKLGVSDMQ